jgi:hypothetical protein
LNQSLNLLSPSGNSKDWSQHHLLWTQSGSLLIYLCIHSPHSTFTLHIQLIHFCVLPEHTLNPIYVVILTTQFIHIIPGNTLNSQFNCTNCSTGTPFLCSQPEPKAHIHHEFNLNAQFIHFMCSFWSHNLSLHMFTLNTKFIHTVCLPWTPISYWMAR